METNKRTVLGLILILLGIYFLLNNLNLLPFDLPWYFFQWQMILIGIGVVNLLTGNHKGAFVLIAIGTFFFIPEFFPEVSIGDFWPIILVIIGVSFFLRGKKNFLSETTNDNSIDDLTLFGGKEKHINSKAFQGGKVNTMFGGTELDFREAELSSDGASIEVFTMFGGTVLKVPENWNIVSHVTPILGGFEDKKRNMTNNDSNRKLTIRGTVMFGGVEVKRG